MDDERDDVEGWLESRAGENLAGAMVVIVGLVVLGWFAAVLFGWT